MPFFLSQHCFLFAMIHYFLEFVPTAGGVLNKGYNFFDLYKNFLQIRMAFDGILANKIQAMSATIIVACKRIVFL